jgi:hypothetical protein
MATATPLGPPGARRRRSSTPGRSRGRAAIDRQHPSSRGRGAEGLCLGAASLHSGHLRGIGPPNRGPGGTLIPATEQPGIRGLRIGLPARQWRLRDACGPSRLNDFLALWSQAHLPSCNRQVTSTSIPMAKPGRLPLPAVTHRYKRAHCLWLEQFQIADSALKVCPGATVMHGAHISRYLAQKPSQLKPGFYHRVGVRSAAELWPAGLR